MKKFIFSVGNKNKLFKVTALTALTLCLPTMASAYNANANKVEMSQQKADNITGTVTDTNGEPVVGATIKIVGSSNGTVTDVNGKFTLSVAKNAELQISSIGYVTKKITVVSNNLNVVLAEDRASLDEVVVLGYGAGQRKQDLSASVGVINNADKLSVRPVSSTEGMLQGQLAGVTITANGGDPTSAPNIVIRGQGSMNGDNVLWVVDGIPGAPIPSMNDIESIVVLKDAASAAIYGAQSGA